MFANWKPKSEEIRKTNQRREFLETIPKLNGFGFFAAAKILKVQVVKDEVEPNEGEGCLPVRDTGDILEDMMDKFLAMDEKARKRILRLLKQGC